MLKVEHLTVCRGSHPVLRDVSFTLEGGQTAAVLGLNGAGKTTLLKALLGFIPKAEGSAEADGRALWRLSPADRAKKLAYVPQRYDGGFRFRTEDFVSMGATAYLGAFSRPGRDELDRARRILADLGCASLIGRAMDRLSGGEQRMAYLARAVMQDAAYLLLDEPVSSLDFSRQHVFLGHLRRYVRERQSGCLITLHAPELAYAYADRFLILHEGRLLLDLSREDEGFQPKLDAALHTLYGPALRTRFQDGALLLGWSDEARR